MDNVPDLETADLETADLETLDYGDLAGQCPTEIPPQECNGQLCNRNFYLCENSTCYPCGIASIQACTTPHCSADRYLHQDGAALSCVLCRFGLLLTDPASTSPFCTSGTLISDGAKFYCADLADGVGGDKEPCADGLTMYVFPANAASAFTVDHACRADGPTMLICQNGTCS